MASARFTSSTLCPESGSANSRRPFMCAAGTTMIRSSSSSQARSQEGVQQHDRGAVEAEQCHPRTLLLTGTPGRRQRSTHMLKSWPMAPFPCSDGIRSMGLSMGQFSSLRLQVNL